MNEAAFDEITEQSAYWIGFLMADGCVTTQPKGNLVLSLSLARKDRMHIESFAAFLGTNKPICDEGDKVKAHRFPGGITRVNKYPYSRLAINSTRICEQLERFGVTKRKSLTAKVIGLEGDKHFWRGLVDGDGSVAVRPFRKHQKPTLSLVGSQAIVEQFADFCESAINRRPVISFSKSVTVANLAYSHACGMARFLYDGCSVSLPRKSTIAKEMMELQDCRREHPKNILLTVNGETKGVPQWAVEMGISENTIRRRLEKGWPHEDAVLAPLGTRK